MNNPKDQWVKRSPGTNFVLPQGTPQVRPFKPLDGRNTPCSLNEPDKSSPFYLNVHQCRLYCCFVVLPLNTSQRHLSTRYPNGRKATLLSAVFIRKFRFLSRVLPATQVKLAVLLFVLLKCSRLIFLLSEKLSNKNTRQKDTRYLGGGRGGCVL